MPVLFDDLKPGDVVSYKNESMKEMRHILYIGKKRGLSDSLIEYSFLAKQFRKPYKSESSYKITEAFQPLDFIRYYDAISSVKDKLMVKYVPKNSFVWEYLGFQSPDETDLPWHHLITLCVIRMEQNKRAMSRVEEVLFRLDRKDLFKESRARTAFPTPQGLAMKKKGVL